MLPSFLPGQPALEHERLMTLRLWKRSARLKYLATSKHFETVLSLVARGVTDAFFPPKRGNRRIQGTP
jgi:hypothetical protein